MNTLDTCAARSRLPRSCPSWSAEPRGRPALLPAQDVLLGEQVLQQLVAVAKAAQGVHAVQHVGVDVLQAGQRADLHLPGDGLLWLGLIFASSVDDTAPGVTHSSWPQALHPP